MNYSTFGSVMVFVVLLGLPMGLNDEIISKGSISYIFDARSILLKHHVIAI